jgi:hypothetical protein
MSLSLAPGTLVAAIEQWIDEGYSNDFVEI